MTDLRQAAQALLNRWDSPLWKNGSTADAIADLRTALAVHKVSEFAQAQEQAEPVGEVTDAVDGAFKCEFSQHLPVGTKLYTAQPQRKPLSDEEIEQAQRAVWRSLPSDFDYTTSSWIEIGIRYAEAAHGIKEGT